MLTLFSWTGISRTAGVEKKQSFQACEGILAVLCKLIQFADSRWNSSKNEKLFKNHILKHAKQINEAATKKKKPKANNVEVEVAVNDNRDIIKEEMIIPDDV